MKIRVASPESVSIHLNWATRVILFIVMKLNDKDADQSYLWKSIVYLSIACHTYSMLWLPERGHYLQDSPL